MSANPTESDGNNPVSRSSQNKSQLLEAMVRNVPKLKELNYTQWKNIMTNSIKKAKLWGYVDGSIEEPSEHESGSLATYYDEAGAVRNAIHGSLEPAAQKYLEEALDPREAWLTLEKKYMTAESDADARLVSIEQQLADLRLEEGGDVIEHIAEFCRMRSQLSGSRFAVDDQACLTMLYRSLPSSYRQSTLTPEGTEMKDFNTLCARLAYVSQSLESEASAKDTPPVPVEDYTNWGVPDDVKAFGLTGGKNPLLEERAAATCRDCLLKDHKAGTPQCPQYTWRKELWGMEENENGRGSGDSGDGLSSELPMPANSKRLGYEFSEPVKVVLNFDEIGLKPGLRIGLQYSIAKPSAIQQCAILPIIYGRNVIAQAPANNGKTVALAISLLQLVNPALPHAQALVFTSTGVAANAFKQIVSNIGHNLSVRCYVCDPSNPLARMSPTSLTDLNKYHIFVGTPEYLLELVRRNLINIRKLRTVALDDIDKLIKTGAEEQIHEAYQYIPPLTQVIASSTVYSLSIAKAVAKLMADPLQVLVHRNEGMSVGIHFYVKVPANQKPRALLASFSVLQADGVVVLCHDVTQIKGSYFYYLQESMKPQEREVTISNFKSYSNGRRSSDSGFGYYHSSSSSSSTVALVVPDKSFSTTGLLNVGVPLIEYDIPGSVEEYAKRLDRWRVVDPGRAHTIITFVTADTEEVQVVQGFEQCYGIHVAELLWDGNSLR